MSEIAVIGAGYVGLTTAACLAHLGHDVVCADIDAERVAALARARCPILEEGLPALVAEGLGAAPAAVRRRRAPTPRAAPSSCSSACRRRRRTTARRPLRRSRPSSREIAPVLRAGHGRGQQVDDAGRLDAGSSRASSAEAAPTERRRRRVEPRVPARGHRGARLPPADRVVIGCDDTAVAVRVSELYRDVQAPILVTDPASAEMIKYASNAFLATKISFINAIANLCEAVERRRARGRARHGLRPAHRLRVPAPRARATAARASRRTPRRCCTPPTRRATTSACSRAWST